jgi:hypothetical protein
MSLKRNFMAKHDLCSSLHRETARGCHHSKCSRIWVCAEHNFWTEAFVGKAALVAGECLLQVVDELPCGESGLGWIAAPAFTGVTFLSVDDCLVAES